MHIAVITSGSRGDTEPYVALGGALVVGEETIKTHVGNILAKLQMAHRTRAVIRALKQGLLSLGDIDVYTCVGSPIPVSLP